MKRRWFLVLGVGIIAANLWLLITLDSPIIEEPASVATTLAFLLAGVLFVLGGVGERLGSLDWYQFVGLANVVMGVGFVATYLVPMAVGTSAYDGTTGTLFAVSAMIGGSSLAFIGLDWVRGGQHFDPSTYE